MEKTIKWKIEIDDSQAQGVLKRLDSSFQAMAKVRDAATKSTKTSTATSKPASLLGESQEAHVKAFEAFKKQSDNEEKQREKVYRQKEANQRRVKKLEEAGMQTIKQNALLAIAPISQPFSFWSNAIAYNRIQAMLNTPQGGALLGRLGMGATTFTGTALGAMIALGATIKALNATMQKAIEAIRFSSKLYLDAGRSGLGIGAQAQRSLIARVMGVDEREIFQFGGALQYIQPRIKAASESMSRNAVALTSVNFGFKILEVNFLAFASNIAVTLAPALSTLAQMATDVVMLLNRFSDAIGALIKTLAKFLTGLGASVLFGGGAGQAIVGGLTEWAKSASGRSQGLPNVQTFAKQMPVSSWERMGFVIGASGKNYAADTAKNTKTTANLLEKVLIKMTNDPTGMSVFNPAFNHP